MDDNLLKTVLTVAPNLIFAAWFIMQQGKTIDALLANQTKILDRLLTYVDSEKAKAEAARPTVVNSS